MRHAIACLISSALLLGGCAHLKFTADDPELHKDSMVFYPQGLFAAVSEQRLADGVSCGPVAQLFYMPDFGHPRYIRPVAGYGSSNLTANFSNGLLTGFGQQTDASKAASDLSTLATVAGLVTAGPAGAAAGAAAGSAAKTLQSLAAIGIDPKIAAAIIAASGGNGGNTPPAPTPCPDMQAKLYRAVAASGELSFKEVVTGLDLRGIIQPAATPVSDDKTKDKKDAK